MCELFSKLSTIVQTQHSTNLDRRKYTFDDDFFLFNFECAFLSCQLSEFFGRMPLLRASSLASGHMTLFFCGFLDNRGGTTYPPAQLTPLSPTSTYIGWQRRQSNFKWFQLDD